MLEDQNPNKFGGDCRAFLTPLIENTTWMKWLGVFLILIGVIYCITIIGLIIGWLPLWLGLLVYQSASRLQELEVTNDEASAVEVITKLATYFKVSGITVCVVVAFYAIIAVVILWGFIAG